MFQRFVFDDVAAIPVEAFLQQEQDVGIDNGERIATHIETEREAVRVVARAEGFEAGLAFARTEREAAIEASLARIAEAIAHTKENGREASDALANATAALALEMAQAIAGAAMAAHPTATIEAALRDVFAEAIVRPKLVVRVAETDRDAVAAAVARLRPETFEGHVTLVGDAGIAAGDCCIDWRTGGIELSQAERLEAARRLAGL